MDRHARTPLLEEAFDAVNGVSALAGRVRDETSSVGDSDHFPLAAVVPFREERVASTHDGVQHRSLEITAWIWARSAEERDALALQVETALAAADFPGGLYVDTEFGTTQTAGAGVIHAAGVRWRIPYFSQRGSPAAT